MGFIRIGLAAALLAGGLVAQERTGTGFAGGQACQPCHPDVSQGFSRNPHFTAGERTDCEGCHGPGAEHISGGGDLSKIVRFPELEPSAVLERCLACHSKDFGKMQIRRSAHSTAEVGCISCHSIHGAGDRSPLLAVDQKDLCYSCHTEVRAQFDLPFKHRVNEGAMECSDCHDPHGAPTSTWGTAHSSRMTAQAFGSDQPCLACHTDKRGPFVHEHPPVRVDGCATCHSPHGSTNARLLARPAAFTLCLECHSNVSGFGTSGGGIPNPTPGFHNLADPSFQNCVTCHARIHGSNADPLFRR